LVEGVRVRFSRRVISRTPPVPSKVARAAKIYECFSSSL